jgi:hypothetical protein
VRALRISGCTTRGRYENDHAITGLGHVFVSKSFRIGIVRKSVVYLYRICLRGTDVVFQNDDRSKRVCGGRSARWITSASDPWIRC